MSSKSFFWLAASKYFCKWYPSSERLNVFLSILWSQRNPLSSNLTLTLFLSHICCSAHNLVLRYQISN
jgi:hypothetical protein